MKPKANPLQICPLDNQPLKQIKFITKFARWNSLDSQLLHSKQYWKHRSNLFGVVGFTIGNFCCNTEHITRIVNMFCTGAT